MRFLPPALCFLLLFVGSCANMVPPSGGKKDITPPKLVSISPKDSTLNTRPKTIELEFDEYIQVTDAANQIRLSPLLPIPLTVTNTPHRVIVHIPDTMLLGATTYHLSFGNAISDLHEGNLWQGGGYTFSTGTFFDSLRITGRVISAPTGLPDTSALVMLYSADESDSAVVRHRPLYVTHTDASGRFSLEGLPPRAFRLYALRDPNSNLTFDGGAEWIGFNPTPFTPRTDTVLSFLLHSFQERPDSATAASGTKAPRNNRLGSGGQLPANVAYLVNVDTSDIKRRTQELNKPLIISFRNRPSAINTNKIFLSSDSAGIVVEAPIRVTRDSSNSVIISSPWRDNAVYTLRLQKGFAKDSAGADLMPGRYTFRTHREEDYGTLRVHLPSRFAGGGYVLQVAAETDTVHQKTVTDTVVNLRYLPAARYTIRVIEDLNRNGIWDPGDLFLKKQPEIVIPYDIPILLKAGWDNYIDFEKPDRPKPPPTNR